MKINLVEVAPPMFSEFQMFAKPDFELLKEKKKVRVSFRKETKTRISTSMQFGQYRVKINFAIEGVKTHEETDFSFVSSERETSNYFVVSKKQDFNAYKDYVSKVIEKVIVNIFKVELDEITIELEGKSF